MIFCLSKEGIIESRQGLLYLPLSPVYGIGGTVIMLILHAHMGNPIILFLYSIFAGSAVEFVSSFVMEKLFNARFWDYSDRPLNIQGRICLQYSIYWGFLGLLLMYIIVPYIYVKLINAFSKQTGEIIANSLLPIVIIAIIITLMAMNKLKRKVNYLSAKNKGLNKEFKNSFLDKVVDLIAPEKLIIWTFPNLSLVVHVQKFEGKKSQKEIKIENTIKKLEKSLEVYTNI